MSEQTRPASVGVSDHGVLTGLADDDHTQYTLHTDTYIPVTFAYKGTVATGTGVLRWYNDSGRTLTIAKIRASAGTAPTGSAILDDVNVDGTTIWSTQGNRVTIAVSANTGSTTTFNTTTIADGSYLTVDIDQVGSTVAGADHVVTIWLKG